MFLKWYDSIMLMLEKITASIAFYADRWNTADGMQNLLSTKQFMASAYLFREIFAMTGPLSRNLEDANIDFGKVLNFLMLLLNNYRNLEVIPQNIIHAVEENFDEIELKEKRISRRRRMPGQFAHDEPATSAVAT